MAFLKKPFIWTKRGVVPAASIRETGLLGGKSFPASFVNEQWTATSEAIEELQLKAGEIKTVNGNHPNEEGNVEIAMDTNQLVTKEWMGDLKLLQTTEKTSIVNALNELFTYASKGKKEIVNALTGKKVSVSDMDSFTKLADAIKNIKVGDYSIGEKILEKNLMIQNELELVWSYIGYTSSINSVAVDVEGNVYSGGYDGILRKLNEKGQLLWSYIGYTGSVNSVAVDVEGNVYSGGYNKTVKKLSGNGQLLWEYTGYTSSVNSVAVDVEGNVYSGGYDEAVKKLSGNGQLLWEYTGYTRAVNSVAVDVEGNVYSGGYNKTVKKLSGNGQLLWEYTGYTSSINSVAVDVEGNVYSGDYAGILRKLNEKGQLLWEYTGHTSSINSVAVDVEGNVYSGGYDKIVRKLRRAYLIRA